MRTLKTLLVSMALSTVWPAYLMTLSYVARLGPWPRSVARPAGFALALTAATMFATSFLRRVFGAKGWAARTFDMPAQVARQLRRARNFLLAAAALLLLPSELLSRGMIAPGGQPIYAHTIDRLLILAFELCFLWACHRVVRRRGALSTWLSSPENAATRLGRTHRQISWSILVGTGLLIALDTQGYGFTARRLALALGQTLVLAGVCWWLRGELLKVVDRHAWRWIRTGGSNHGAPAALDGSEPGSASNRDLTHRVRGIVNYLVPFLGAFVASWIWELDSALFRYVTEQRLWSLPAGDKGGPEAVMVGDLFKAVVIFFATGVIWRHLSTIFAIVVYPRMTDDPGVRFAVLTLCRYVVLGCGLMLGLSAISLGFDKIGMVLAALGVGLGFGLQEIVSNFVSGLILLLERPLRVGDIVTVANMTGKVDRINIRATTIINADNQSMIIPNREFITGNLVNWTHKDKIVRVSVKVGVAYGCDPDRVSDLLLAIAREDPDVLGNPVASAMLEDFSPGSLLFGLHVHVPDPSLTGRVKHRLSAQIQKRFAAAGIEIPLPKQELRFQASDFDNVLLSLGTFPARPAPHVQPGSAPAPAPHLRIDRPPTSLIES